MGNVYNSSLEKLPRGVNAIDDPTKLFRQFYSNEIITVGATDGTETFATANGTETFAITAKKVFTGGITLDFFNQDINVPGPPTQAQNAKIYGATQPIRKFSEDCSSLGSLDKICWRQSQGVEFFRFHADKLCGGGHSNFLPFTKGYELAEEDGSNVVVALVVESNFHCLRVFLLRKLRDIIFDETLQQRIIIPQRLL